MNSPQAVIEAIASAFAHTNAAPVEIPKERVRQWMRSPDLNVRGCLYGHISEWEHAKHITPYLEFEDYYEFVVPHLQECIELDAGGEWVDSRHEAGFALVAWVVDFWDKQVPLEKLVPIKEWLAAFYKRGDEGARRDLVNSVLEHLFERSELAEYFQDWQADPVLASAYADALLWITEMPDELRKDLLFTKEGTEERRKLFP